MAIRQTADGFEVRREVRRRGLCRDEAERLDALLESAQSRALADWGIGLSSCPGIRESLEAFLADFDGGKSLSKSRRRDYRRVLTRFASDLSRGAGDISVDSITTVDLSRWIAARARDPGNRGKYVESNTVSPLTIRDELSMLRCFARWCARRRWCSLDLDVFRVRMPAPRVNKRCNRYPPRAMTESGLMRIMTRLRTLHSPVWTVLRLMMLIGARPQAVLALRRGDVTMPTNERRGTVRIIGLKGGMPTERAYKLGDLTDEALRLALDEGRDRLTRLGKRASKHSLLIPAPRGGVWSVSNFDQTLSRVCRAHNLGRITPYTVRHSALTWLKQRGVSQASIMHYAKHLQMSTQEIYDWSSGELAGEAYAVMEEIIDGRVSTVDEESEVVRVLSGIFEAARPVEVGDGGDHG